MTRDEYLQQRRLQGLNSRIRRANHQAERGRSQIEGMKETFKRHRFKHDNALKKIESRVRQTEDHISSMESQRASLEN
jgi:predicted  nucleic acid-binding Zn-ribbon protein